MKILVWLFAIGICGYSLLVAKDLFQEKNKLGAIVVALFSLSLLVFPFIIKYR
jgi:hypothetical protein